MSAPERFSEGRDPVARRLFEAAREERAPRGAQQRALAALGVAGAATAATGAASGAAGQSALGVALAKWFGGGALVGLVVAGGATVLEPPASASASGTAAAPALTAPVATVTRVAEPVAPRATSEPEPVEPPKAVVAAVPAAAQEIVAPYVDEPKPAPSRGAFEKPQEDTLAAELALLDRARQALARGDAGGAKTLLDQHAREFPRGRLSAEAFVLSLDALVRSGQRAQARSLAEQHLAKNPGSAHAARIKSLVGLP